MNLCVDISEGVLEVKWQEQKNHKQMLLAAKNPGFFFFFNFLL